MKVSNNLQHVNILGNYAVGKNGVTSPLQQTSVQKDAFAKQSVATSPISTNYLSSKIFSSYNSKQLLNAYLNPFTINSLVEANPNVKEILDSHGVEYSVNPENVSKIVNSHVTTTTAYALQIANKMNMSQLDKQMLEQACVFHDFGKTLIPQEILNKPANLSSDEKAIMDLHADLGYELLSTTGMNKRVLNLIKNHHMPQEQNNDILGQILSVADIYSALREERSYKNALTEKEALDILDQKAMKGEVSTEVVNALKASLHVTYAA